MKIEYEFFKLGERLMYKILAAAFILTLTTCYPVHAIMSTGKTAERLLVEGHIINSHFDSTIQKWRLLIKFNDEIYNCVSFHYTEAVENYCYNDN